MLFLNIFDYIINLLKYGPPVRYNEEYSMINGVTVFHDEYKTNDEVKNIKEILKRQSPDVWLRIPFPYKSKQWGLADNLIETALNHKINVLILIDTYYDKNSVLERLKHIRANFNNKVFYFELFNELPHMSYPGKEISGLDQLIFLTNYFNDWIKGNINKSKTLSMAPANSLHDISYSILWGESNEKQLERLIKDSKTDICALHCYVNSITHLFKIKKLKRNLNKYMEKTTNRKEIWITETGFNEWKGHVKYYRKYVSRLNEHLNSSKTMWYRQTIDKKSSNDSGYALHIRETNEFSPLWKLWGEKKIKE